MCQGAIVQMYELFDYFLNFFRISQAVTSVKHKKKRINILGTFRPVAYLSKPIKLGYSLHTLCFGQLSSYFAKYPVL